MMADLVVEGAAAVPAAEVRLKSVTEATADDLVWCDGVAAGSPQAILFVPCLLLRLPNSTLARPP